MPRSVLLLLVAVALCAVAVVLVVTTDPFGASDVPERATPFSTTPLEDLDTTTLTIPRAAFCAAVDQREVAAALGAGPTGSSGYDNGDEVTLSDGATDVAHEFGCTWSLDDGSSSARAWVFAPPVSPERAQQLVLQSTKAEGCRGVEAPAFGDPTVALVCPGGPLTSVSYRGLFGDAWLTCELVAPAPVAGTEELVDRAGAWCAGVARGAAA